jgi:basic membrane protein A and related proteins
VKKLTSLMVMVILILSVALTGCGKSESTNSGQADQKQEEKKVKVGFLFSSSINDGGYSQAHNAGRLAVEKELGVETLYKESVPEGQESEKIMEDMISQGANVIFATSFGYMDFVEKVAKRHPDVKFLHCSGYKQAENMSNYFGRMYQARYLSGIVAGLKTKSNQIGYVGAFPIPEVVRGLNAFTLGVRSVNPNAKVKVVWTQTWYDPAKEKEAAKALLDGGSDVIAQHQNTAGPQQAAQESGAFSIGYNLPMKEQAPKAYMTSAMWNWGTYYVDQVKKVMDGTWKAESYWGGMETGIVGLDELSENAPAEAKEAVEKAKADILSGKNKIFQGPLKDNTGAVKVQEGQVMTDAEMLSFDWLVEGVDGKVK